MWLCSALESRLPPGLFVGRSGERVFLYDAGGAERTVLSVEDALRIIGEYPGQSAPAVPRRINKPSTL